MAKSKVSESKERKEMAEEVAKQVISNLSNNDNGAGNLPNEANFVFGSEAPSEAEYSDNLIDAISFDIFDYCDGIVKKGDQVKYEIRKNGELLTSKLHPCSWDKIQSDFGEGSYQVTARSMVTKKYIKHQTMVLADNPNGAKTTQQRQEETQQTAQQQQSQPSFMEILTLINNLDTKAKNEAREMAKEQATSSNAVVTSMLTLMQSNQQQSQNMFMEIAKLSTSMTEKLTETTNRMFEKMEDRFEKIVEKLSTKKEEKGMDAFQIIKMTEDAQRKGFDMFSKMNDLAEKKLEERLEIMEENKGSNTKSEKTSMLDRLIDNVVPTITSAINKQQQIDAQQRRLLPRQSQRPVQPQAAGHRQGTPNAPMQASTQAKVAQVPTSSTDVRPSNGQGLESAKAITQSNEFGLPTFTPKAAVKEVKVEAPVIETPIIEIPTKESIEKLLVPAMAKCLLKLDSVENGALEIKKVLQENNIPVKLFLDTFKKEDAATLPEKYSLPTEAAIWFEGVYANIEAQA